MRIAGETPPLLLLCTPGRVAAGWHSSVVRVQGRLHSLEEVDDFLARVFGVMYDDFVSFLRHVLRAFHNAVLGIDGGVFAPVVGGFSAVFGFDRYSMSGFIHFRDCAFTYL